MRTWFLVTASFVGVAGCFASLDGFSGGGGAPDAGSDATTHEAGVTASDAGSELDADAATGPACGGRPGVGAAMVHVDNAGFCIDATEVTYSQYADFYAANPEPDPVCGFKKGYSAPLYLSGDGAIGNVDWCDAYQYCKWAGKRLCGGIAGAQLDLNNSTTPLSEWQFACTHGGSEDWPYPYGKTVDPTICLYADSPNSGHSRDVASNPKCVGPAGVFDMSGNVWEWEDACDRSDAGDSASQDCNLRGGGFLRNSSDWGACAAVPSGWDRESHVDDTGIRCCSDFK